MEAMQISLVEVVGSPFCVSVEDGNIVNAQIASAFDKNIFVKVSFSGVTRLTTAFLNAAIGQLYNEYSDEKIREYINVIGASQEDLRLVQKVVENAKLFFSDREKYKAAIKDVFGEND